jgi:hypothetical protein
MTTVGFQSKQMFFDRQAVIDAVGKANARNLSRAGSFIRRGARSSLRRRKRASTPGSPPSVHSRDPVASLKNIWFVFDPQSRSVIVGPVKLNGPVRLSGSNRTTVPALQELGGVAVVTDGPRRRRRERLATYPKRPFMGPAMQRELPKFTGLWANSVK